MIFKDYQRHDYTRAALTRGLVLAHDTGLGKSWAGFTIPFLWLGWQKSATGLTPNRPVLLVTPGDQHDNITAEGTTHFRVKVRRLENQDALLGTITRNAEGRPSIPPGFYLTSYHELAMNGVEKFPDLTPDLGPRDLLGKWGWSEAGGHQWYADRGIHFRDQYQRIGAAPTFTASEIRQAADRAETAIRDSHAAEAWKTIETLRIRAARDTVLPYHTQWADAPFAHLPLSQQSHVLRDWLSWWLNECRENLSEDRVLANGHKVTCVHSPAMVDLCGDMFAAVVVDEGVRMKSDDTIIGQGIRRLRPEHRLVLTATPIKNRLPDIFWLVKWADGMEGASTRFPYEATDESKQGFAEEFMVKETNLTQMRAAKAKKPGRFKRLSPEACNLHRLWKLLASVVLRRSKADTGEDIVPKNMHLVETPLGTTQAAVIAYHLTADYGLNISAKAMALRQASACPHTANLRPRDGDQKGPYRAPQPLTPKVFTALRLVCNHMRGGRQGVVFSVFHEVLDTLGRLLDEAGVRHVILDGRVSPKRRGPLSQKFQRGRQPGGEDLPVALCATDAMGEGHNWPRASYCVRYDLSLPCDKNTQCVNRVHRLTSERPVDVYDLVNTGTVDVMLANLNRQKGDTADLVLDGRLLGQRPAEVNLAELLDYAAAAYSADKTIPEASLAAEWVKLREELRAAQRAWDLPGAEREETSAELTPLPVTWHTPTPRRGLEWLIRLAA